MMNDQGIAITNCLKKLAKELEAQDLLKEELYFANDPVANKFIIHNPNAFFLGVIFDQGVPAERAWAAPYNLYLRLGHIDPDRIKMIPFAEFSSLFAQPPALHRYVVNMARYIQESCKLLSTEYQGNASHIWNDNPTAKDLEHRFLQFKGIGQKKAAMAVGILARSFRIPIRDIFGIDVAYDIHVRRVFTRSGLSEQDDLTSIIESARLYNPEFPGELDYPAWYTGRTWCHLRNPDCVHCALANICAKKIANESIRQLDFGI